MVASSYHCLLLLNACSANQVATYHCSLSPCDIMYVSHHITAPPTLDLSERDCLRGVSKGPNSGVVTLLATVLDLGSVAKALTNDPKAPPSRV